MKVLVEKLGSSSDSFNSTLATLPPSARATAVNDHYDSIYSRLLTFEFSRDRKSMSVLARRQTADTNPILYVKGAPESILDRCTSVQLPSGGNQPLTTDLRNRLNEVFFQYGKLGLRTLALAYVEQRDGDADHYKTESSAEYVRFEKDMTFVGFVGMLDPPRPEVKAAVENCRNAGIRVVVIT
jgi:Ca2+ transporting ATPase